MLAHVDHGKSALSDSLISGNGIISARSAGKVRLVLMSFSNSPEYSNLEPVALDFRLTNWYPFLKRYGTWTRVKMNNDEVSQ